MSVAASPCPRCARPLRPVGTQGQAEACPAGHGLFLGARELARALDPEHAHALAVAANGSPILGGACPACGLPMREVRFWQAEFVVEACVGCDGCWFDEGELARVRDDGLAPMRHAVPDVPAAVRDLLFRIGGGPARRR